jgi:hypothetical protein
MEDTSSHIDVTSACPESDEGVFLSLKRKLTVRDAWTMYRQIRFQERTNQTQQACGKVCNDWKYFKRSTFLDLLFTGACVIIVWDIIHRMDFIHLSHSTCISHFYIYA